jgi:hypothetical protein
MGKTHDGLRRLWRPGEETLEAIAGVLSEHWRAAARLSPALWQAPARWLKSSTSATELDPHHFTTGGKLIR